MTEIPPDSILPPELVSIAKKLTSEELEALQAYADIALGQKNSNFEPSCSVSIKQHLLDLHLIKQLLGGFAATENGCLIGRPDIMAAARMKQLLSTRTKSAK